MSVVAEESGKPLAQIACKHGIHPSLPCRWRDELAENPKEHSAAMATGASTMSGAKGMLGNVLRSLSKIIKDVLLEVESIIKSEDDR